MSPDTRQITDTSKVRIKVVIEVGIEDLKDIISTLDIYLMMYNYWIEEITYLSPDFGKQESARA